MSRLDAARSRRPAAASDPGGLRLGIPTHPRQDPVGWIRWAREHNFDFVELFIESPACSLDLLDRPDRRRVLRRELTGFPCLGHLPPCLPLGSPFPELRRAVVAVVARYARYFAALDCPAMTVHANWASSLVSIVDEIAWQRDTLARAAGVARREGVELLFELVPHWADSPAHDAAIIAGIPGLGYMFDVGHGNLCGRRVGQYLNHPKLFPAMRHLHLHDNDGQGDRHWPIIPGRDRSAIDWPNLLRTLKRRRYRGTATLEFHSGGRRAFLQARQWLRTLWRKL